MDSPSGPGLRQKALAPGLGDLRVREDSRPFPSIAVVFRFVAVAIAVVLFFDREPKMAIAGPKICRYAPSCLSLWRALNVAKKCTHRELQTTCMCEPGYTGKNCESGYIPCSPSPCQNGGTCKQSTKYSYECKCPPEQKAKKTDARVNQPTSRSTETHNQTPGKGSPTCRDHQHRNRREEMPAATINGVKCRIRCDVKRR
uniref:Uncharacterized protein n=1 Tax=Anopheles atroparvus TaxID=41427 RepID=A0A182JL65_ANOAO